MRKPRGIVAYPFRASRYVQDEIRIRNRCVFQRTEKSAVRYVCRYRVSATVKRAFEFVIKTKSLPFLSVVRLRFHRVCVFACFHRARVKVFRYEVRARKVACRQREF